MLQAMVGEMRRTRGEVVFGGKISYAPQIPWIRNATFRENIFFGQPEDEERYATCDYTRYILFTKQLDLIGYAKLLARAVLSATLRFFPTVKIRRSERRVLTLAVSGRDFCCRGNLAD